MEAMTMLKSINVILNTGKKKVLTFVLCGTLILALGSGGIAYAASGADKIFPKGFTIFAQSDDGNGSISVKDEDGIRSYSTDGGKTWSQTPPEGLVETPIEYSALSGEDGVSVRASVRTNENGTLSYSTDGGKTWSKEVPAGLKDFSFSVNQDGNSANGKFGEALSVVAKGDNGNGTIIEDIEVRALSDEDGVSVRASVRTNEDGTLSYSTDGGKTWSKDVPAGLEGITFSVDQDGNGASGKLGD
jgi:Neuraminidase (sialidase)